MLFEQRYGDRSENQGQLSLDISNGQASVIVMCILAFNQKGANKRGSSIGCMTLRPHFNIERDNLVCQDSGFWVLESGEYYAP